jgi:2-(1,2-epoxy-1,2-dihydrophenyl)acetyl-CoA isomerase
LTEGLSVGQDGGVLTLTIDRAEVQNALTHDVRMAMVEQLERAGADLAVRAVIITAAGDRAFCTGADLRSPPPQLPKPEGAPERPVGSGARMIRTGWQRLVGAVLDCEKPVVAAVNGTAAGGGMHLALACDLVLMADTARFIEVFVRRGIIPDAGGAFLLPRLIGVAKTKELMFYGDDLPALEAERLGLVNKVVPAAELAKTAADWAARLASGPTRALSLTKWLVNRSLSSDRETSFAEEAWAQEVNNFTEDSREGMVSFMERRSPEFKGW